MHLISHCLLTSEVDADDDAAADDAAAADDDAAAADDDDFVLLSRSSFRCRRNPTQKRK